jgi:hypothetical protein
VAAGGKRHHKQLRKCFLEKRWNSDPRLCYYYIKRIIDTACSNHYRPLLKLESAPPSLSAVRHVRNCPVLFDMDVEAIGVEVLGHHHTGLNDASLLRKVFLAEALLERVLVRVLQDDEEWPATCSFRSWLI